MVKNRNALTFYNMVHSDNISDFILELIEYAKDEDIITLLEYIPNKMVVNSQPKSLLIENIFSPIYHSVQYSLNNLPVEITFKKEYTKLPKNFEEYLIYNESYKYFYPLYLHLYALCESYYSYFTFSADEKKRLLNMIKKLLTKEQKKQIESTIDNISKNANIQIITPKDKEKILSLLINCYKDNGFYYFFNNDELTKVEITETKKGKQFVYSYDYTEYDLIQTEDSTRIINRELKIDSKITKIPIMDMDYDINSGDNPDDVLIRILEDRFKHVNFQTIKSIHKDIVKVLTKPKQAFCRCCNPNPYAKKTPDLCENCTALINALDYLSKNIDELDGSSYIATLKDKISKDNIFEDVLNQKQNDPKIREKRRRKLKNIINTVTKNIDKQLAKNIQEKQNYYAHLKRILNGLEDNIKAVFG